MLVIIDYGIGNLGSVYKAFRYLDIPVRLTSDKKEILKAEGVILPGVGAFGEGMNNLRQLDLKDVIRKTVQNRTPFLGICLGMQLLFSKSEEDPGVKGLNLVSGQVKKFDKNRVDKIPQMGWNQVELQRQDPLFEGLKLDENFYFVHSYYVTDVEPEVTLGITNYGKQNYVSVIRKKNIWGFQCHPEKSSQTGLKILKNFYEEVKKWK